MSRNETKEQTLDRVLNISGLRTIERHSAIDLDWFLGLPSEQRQAVWRAWPELARRQCIIQQFARKQDGDWGEDQVATALAYWNAKWGSEPSASEAATFAALEDGHNRAAVAEYQAIVRNEADEASYFAAERAAYRRALVMYQRGIRPTQEADGSWLVPSASGEATYMVSRAGVCSCPAGANDRHCKHVALISAIETGLDNLNVYDDYDIEAEYAEAAAAIARRLTVARQRYVEAA